MSDGAGSPTRPSVAPDARSFPGRHLFLVVFAPLLALFLATARTDLPYHIDAATNVFASWTIGTTGSPVLERHAVLALPEHRAVFAWVVPSPRGPVAQYPPGTALLAAPLYAIGWRDAPEVTLAAENAPGGDTVRIPIPSLWPAAIVASVTTAAGLAFTALTVRELGGSTTTVTLAAAIGGLGTSAWTVAADALWQHGPDMLWVSLGLYLAVRQRWLASGVALGLLAGTRPPVILVGAAIGVLLLLQRRWGPAMRVALGASPGVAALFAYNGWVFGMLTVAGGYGEAYATRGLSGDVGAWAGNVLAAAFDAQVGLFVWSPFLAMLLFGLRRAARSVGPVPVAAALGGLAYLLLQLKLNRASGGAGFHYYRYPLEAITAAGPVLAFAWRDLWARGLITRFALGATSVFAIAAHAVRAL